MEDHIIFDRRRMVLDLLDQRALPLREERIVCARLNEVIEAIANLTVRGAPAIGVAAAWGCALAAREAGEAGEAWSDRLERDLERLKAARPTAVNLGWAVERMRGLWRAQAPRSPEELVNLWLDEAAALQAGDNAANRAMGDFGAALLEDGDTVLTHCNAGALATAGWGTALGVIRSAVAQGKKIRVISDETRPVLQGARLTCFELHKDGIPVLAACDNAAGLLMQKGMVDKVITGADRIAANGDTANKIGTYTVALLAREHGIPFYIAAPLSTIDPAAPNGDYIPIEKRDGAEVAWIGDRRILPEGVEALNYAFDVTPARLITAIITEKGVLRPPYAASIAAALGL